jgi:6-phosphogluconate dehydrogenase
MVHNGIEYGMMQAIAEGFNIMKAKEAYSLNLAKVCDIWAYGSVVRSWLLELTGRALKDDPALDRIQPWVADSGEGRWTVKEAIDLDIAAPVITLALQTRLASRDQQNYTARVLAAMRNQFGGHAVKAAE